MNVEPKVMIPIERSAGFLSRARRVLARARLRGKLALFGNNCPVQTNLLYGLYSRRARDIWRRKHAAMAPEDDLAGRQLASNGYHVIPPAVDRELASAVKSKVDDLFGRGKNVHQLTPQLARLMDGLESVPEIVEFINGAVERAIEAYFRSHFKIHGVYFYRTVPAPMKPESSFLWHVDNVPSQEIKLMIYLDDTVEETGAFRCKDKPFTDRLKKNGWWDRTLNRTFADVLEDPSTTHTIEGPTGTCILFQNGGCAHKATAPQCQHRDVVTFVIIPSDVHWRAHLARNRHKVSTNCGICRNPYTDRPSSVGYHE
jgi:hypothetical protein